MKKNKFNPGTRITIFFVFFAALFFALGLWQIERGQSKTILLDEFEKNSITNPKYISKDSKKWDRVFFEGTWEGSNQILIDNVINRGVAGYKVLTPFRISDTERMILIDRGWLKRNTDIKKPNLSAIKTTNKVYAKVISAFLLIISLFSDLSDLF